MALTKTLKFLYYLNIALLPGLAVVGYCIANLQGKIPDVDGGIAGLTYLVMAFMSIFAILSVNVAKYPKSNLTAFIAIIDTPVSLLVMYFWGLEINFWEGCVMAFMVEMNALLLSSSVFTIRYPKLDFMRESPYADKYALSTNKVFYGYLLVNGVLLNFTMYGLYFWNQLFEQAWWQVIPLAYAFLETTYFFFRTFREREAVAKGGEAVAVLGPEFVSGVILVPTWGMGLLVYPLLLIFVYSPAEEQKVQVERKADRNKEASVPIDYSYYSIFVENSAPQYLPEAPQSNGDSCRSTLLSLQIEDLQVPDFQLAVLSVELSEKREKSEDNRESIYPELVLTLANYRDRPYNIPYTNSDAYIRLVLRGKQSEVLGIGKYAVSVHPKEYGKLLCASISLRGKKQTYPFSFATGYVEITYLSQEYLCAYLDIKSSDGKGFVRGYLTCQIKQKS